jgi:hypothetical protein
LFILIIIGESGAFPPRTAETFAESSSLRLRILPTWRFAVGHPRHDWCPLLREHPATHLQYGTDPPLTEHTQIPINASFAVLFPLITPFPLQRAVMIRERSAGLYRTSSFFLAKVVLEIPNAIVPRLPYYVLLYFM